MNTSQSLTKIAPALARAQAEFRAVGKSGDNTFDRYYYSTLEDYMMAIRPVLNANGLTDGQLCEHFCAHQDDAAFEVLMRRHGPMV